jgi:uncharacterized protein YecE (DUF72 family)
MLVRSRSIRAGPAAVVGPHARGGAMIRVGVAGWDYPDWSGVVYPAERGRRLDRLTYLSEFVDVVEINSTFYRPASPRVAESWLRRTAQRDDFRFTAKSHRSWTHEGATDPRASVEPTLAGLRPLLDAGRLGALLIQFPQSVHYEPGTRLRLDHLLDRVEGWPVAVEVRHASWAVDEVEEWFARRSVGWCLVDQPRVGRSTVAPLARVTAPLAYMRLHGRNAADWFRPDAGRDARYDYLYAPLELQELVASAREMAASAEQLFVVQNNHFRGKALVNALQMKQLLEGRPPRAPASLVAAYPGLESRVRAEPRGLF